MWTHSADFLFRQLRCNVSSFSQKTNISADVFLGGWEHAAPVKVAFLFMSSTCHSNVVWLCLGGDGMLCVCVSNWWGALDKTVTARRWQLSALTSSGGSGVRCYRNNRRGVGRGRAVTPPQPTAAETCVWDGGPNLKPSSRRQSSALDSTSSLWRTLKEKKKSIQMKVKFIPCAFEALVDLRPVNKWARRVLFLPGSQSRLLSSWEDDKLHTRHVLEHFQDLLHFIYQRINSRRPARPHRSGSQILAPASCLSNNCCFMKHWMFLISTICWSVMKHLDLSDVLSQKQLN